MREEHTAVTRFPLPASPHPFPQLSAEPRAQKIIQATIHRLII